MDIAHRLNDPNAITVNAKISDYNEGIIEEGAVDLDTFRVERQAE